MQEILISTTDPARKTKKADAQEGNRANYSIPLVIVAIIFAMVFACPMSKYMPGACLLTYSYAPHTYLETVLSLSFQKRDACVRKLA